MMRQTLAPVIAAALLVAACSDTQGPTAAGDNQLQVSAQVINGGNNGNTATVVEIQSATIVLGGLKLETAGLDNTVDWVLEQSIVIPLALNGTAFLAYDVDVTPGIYKEFELSIDKLEIGNPAEDPLIAQYPGLADASVLVEGLVTRPGESPVPFAFSAPVDIDLELPFAAPMEFTADDNPIALIALEVDVSMWFMGQTDMLDPTDPANWSDIEGNIQASIDVYEED